MTGEPVPLSQDTERQLADCFESASLSRVQSMLLEYGVESWHREVERVRFDILYLAAGDPEIVRRLTNCAKRDYRDVLSREYRREDGRYIPYEWAHHHPANRRSA